MQRNIVFFPIDEICAMVKVHTMKKIIPALVLIIPLLSCLGSHGKPDEAIRRDFERYETQLARISHFEIEAGVANRRATDDPEGNDASYSRALKAEIIPAFRSYRDGLRAIEPVTNEITGIHEILKKRADIVLEGFIEIEQGARTGSAAAVEKAKKLFAEGKLYHSRWSEKMDELHKLYPPKK